MESVDEIFYMPDDQHVWDRTATLQRSELSGAQ